MALLFANNSSLTNITALPSSVSGGGLNLIKTQTASSSSSISFVNGVDGVVLDGTYKEYIFKFINIHNSIDNAVFTFNGSTDGGSNYNVVKTTSTFGAYHNEADNNSGLTYFSGNDIAQGTGYQNLFTEQGIQDDVNSCGELHLFAPSSDTFVKHFIFTCSDMLQNDYARQDFVGGYFNTQNAINAIDFKMSSGNIDDGIIKLYGVS